VRWVRAFLLPILLAGAGAAAAEPESASRDEPLQFQADRLEFDGANNRIRAEGAVELVRGANVLKADRIVLDRNTGVARAEDNVTLLEEGGGVLHADSVELTEDLKDGLIEEFKARLGNRSRLAASRGQLHAGTRAELTQAVFTACQPCRKNPDKAPLWQVKARRIAHDRAEREIVYRDAVLEMWGLPVLYTPYLRHPDPTVTRKSGFLPPSIEHNRDLGLRLETPWFWNIAPDRDATFTPIVASKRGFIGAGEYRQLFPHSRLEAAGSLAALSEAAAGEDGSPRGHIRLKGETHPDADWRIRGQFYRASDDAYLDLAGIDSSETLPSFVDAEGFLDRAYARASLFDVQDLREGISDDASPLAAPELLLDWRSAPSADGIWSARAAGAALHRRRGDSNRRVRLEGGWRGERFTDGGHRLDARIGARGDFAHGDGAANGAAVRLLPHASAGWRYLLAGQFGAAEMTLEPRAQAVLGRNDSHADRFPVEDSQAVEFEFANLFDMDRIPGLDGAETGARIDYGLELGLHSGNDWHIDAGLGQSRRRRANSDAPPGSGLDTAVSDIVGRVDLTAGDATSLNYRFRLDKDDLSARQTALNLATGFDSLRLDLRYAKTVANIGDTGEAAGTREQIDFTLREQIDGNWTVFGRHRRDLDAGSPLLYGFGLIYEDECLLLETVLEREFDVAGGDGDNRAIVRIVLRGLSDSS